MLLEIKFENEAGIFTPNYEKNGEKIILDKMILPPEEEMEQVASTLPILNNCLKWLEEEVPVNEVELNRKSLLAFIDEAVTHKEYCTSQMLLFFEDYLSYSLGDGTTSYLWADATRQDENAREKGLSASATAEDIKAIHEMMADGGTREKYLCKSYDNPKVLLIQVVYSLLLHTFRRGHIIKRCDRCGRVFIPTRPSDKYCQWKTDGKTCGEIRKAEAQRRSHDKEDKKLYKNIDNMLLNRREYETQDEFRKGYKRCKTDKQRKAYLAKWYKKTLKRKPKSAI